MQCVFLELSMDIAFACFAHVCMNCRSIWFCTLNLLRPPVSMSFLSELSRRAREKCESLVALVACEWLLSLRSRPFSSFFLFSSRLYHIEIKMLMFNVLLWSCMELFWVHGCCSGGIMNKQMVCMCWTRLLAAPSPADFSPQAAIGGDAISCGQHQLASTCWHFIFGEHLHAWQYMQRSVIKTWNVGQSCN